MSNTADLASGKGHGDENFPVASRLVAARHRAPILAFYRFARAADDIADHPDASPATKYARLDAMRAALEGRPADEPIAAALRDVLDRAGLNTGHALDLLVAFRQDVERHRYRSWEELTEYCRFSAMPVGRFVLDVHGQARTTWPASDALCTALQIINHLQDCGRDYRALDRVYLPLDLLDAVGIGVSDLGRAQATPALRSVIGTLAGRCQDLLAVSHGLPGAVRDRRLGAEVAVIQRLAISLAARLRVRDPLSQRVHHGRVEALLVAAGAALPRLLRR